MTTKINTQGSTRQTSGTVEESGFRILPGSSTEMGRRLMRADILFSAACGLLFIFGMVWR